MPLEAPPVELNDWNIITVTELGIRDNGVSNDISPLQLERANTRPDTLRNTGVLMTTIV